MCIYVFIYVDEAPITIVFSYLNMHTFVEEVTFWRMVKLKNFIDLYVLLNAGKTSVKAL